MSLWWSCWWSLGGPGVLPVLLFALTSDLHPPLFLFIFLIFSCVVCRAAMEALLFPATPQQTLGLWTVLQRSALHALVSLHVSSSRVWICQFLLGDGTLFVLFLFFLFFWGDFVLFRHVLVAFLALSPVYVIKPSQHQGNSQYPFL